MLEKPIVFSIKCGYKGIRSQVKCCKDMVMSDVYAGAGIPTTATATGTLMNGDGIRKLELADIINEGEYKHITFSQGSSSAS